MSKTPNRGLARVELGAHWTTYAEQLPGLEMLGVIYPAHTEPMALAKRSDGQYVAVKGRYITQLVNRKIEGALRNAQLIDPSA